MERPEVRSRRNLIVCLALLAGAASAATAPTSIAAGSSGRIAVTIVDSHGHASPDNDGIAVICPVDPKHPRVHRGSRYHTSLGKCVAPKRGHATLKHIRAGRVSLYTFGPMGEGPCYSSRGPGYGNAQCARLRVRAGRTVRVKWRVPMFG
jgi:hypothetical protein